MEFIGKLLADTAMIITEALREALLKYSDLIHAENARYNLTGFKTRDEIYSKLMLGSIEPVRDLHVPHGTRFADIGTGAGVPGIPLALCFPGMSGVLIDSHAKKVSFVRHAIEELHVSNAEVRLGRVEELAREELRDRFDLVFARAAGNIYCVVETGAPMCKRNGLLVIYSNEDSEELPASLIEHADRLSIVPLDRTAARRYGLQEGVMVFHKTGTTDVRYPRRMPAIKREIKRNQLEERTP